MRHTMNLLDMQREHIKQHMADAEPVYQEAIERLMKWEELSPEGKIARVQHKLDKGKYISHHQWVEYKRIMERDHNIVVNNTNLRGWN